MAGSGNRRLRVLLVDDQEGDLLLMRATLRAMPGWDCEMEWASSLDEALAAHRQGGHDIYLLDYRLGPCTGLDVRRQLVACGCRAPMIILTGFGDAAVDREAMRAGAADYLEKQELTPAVLARAIEHALERERLERELEASEERCRSARAAVAAAERMSELGTLAGGMAHEFNNLHAIILGALERGLAIPGIPDEARRQLEVVRGGAARAAEVARSLLSFARGRGTGFASVSLTRVVRETIELVQGVLAADGVTLRVDLDELPPMPLQAAAVGQVVMNLLLNARDALRGRPAASIEVSCRREAARVVVVVSDNGCGIAHADLARVFEPFFSTKAELHGVASGGAGLGLSLCRTIVESHGGEIGVDSEPGRGSAFTVKLPLAASAPTADGDTAAPARGRVLVVEDEDALRELWRVVLTEAGWSVAEAATGDAALALLPTARVDVVLADLNVPGTRGAELVRRLREQAPAVVVVSGAPLDAETSLLVEAALAKPVGLATIRATLANAVLRQRTASA